MEHNTFDPFDFLEQNPIDPVNFIDSYTTPLTFDQTTNHFENYRVSDDLLYTNDFSLWGNQMDRNLGMSLQRDCSPCEPYSSSNFMTYDDFTSDSMSLIDMERLISTSPGLQSSPAISQQQPSVSSASLSDSSPSRSDQTAISPEESPRQSLGASSSDVEWTCRHCARSFTKKYLRTKHEQVHTKPILCPLAPRCQHRTAMKRDMRRHVAVHHAGDNAVSSPVSAQSFTCDVSGCRYEHTGFKRKDHLTRHIRKVHARLVP
ncbi:uncharacterized protein LY89DRAFT_68601 [Mollisia scopiformis]|uniref:C2H2-type domain-containing protein n=1 Tax=Mollisia scopiformis TaxID=149040 RepID=A0A194X9X6_MOLSC|nr:uncharacterized protein LY89DRAFT_68601 [Mollisia scopiformis]KUJ16971.1 hypothetical protein LY89DRAFT_68601 [Mollisia scopiformis]